MFTDRMPSGVARVMRETEPVPKARVPMGVWGHASLRIFFISRVSNTLILESLKRFSSFRQVIDYLKPTKC